MKRLFTPNQSLVPRSAGTLLAIIVAVLLTLAGINWGVMGLFGGDLVAGLMGAAGAIALTVLCQTKQMPGVSE